ncbi:MAG: PAS domain S-box protein [bacterium]|nr:PAS domain S-box protein [bacterium]
MDRSDSEPKLTLRGALGATVKRDPVARLVSLGLAASIFLFLSPALLWDTYAPIVMLGLVVLSLRWDVGRVSATQERRFWNELALAFGCWLSADLLQPLLPDAGTASGVDYARKILFAAFYVFFVLAVESQPHRRERLITGLERMLTWPAVTVFVLGLSIYFVMVPLIVGPQAAEASKTDLLFYLCLDGALTARLVYLSRTARSSRWRSLYGLLTLGSAALLASDLLEKVNDVVPSWGLSLTFEILWCAYFVMVALAARARHYPYPVEREVSAPAKRMAVRFSGLSAKTMAAALAFPLVHFPAYALGLLEEPSRPARDALVFLWMLLLGTIALVQHRLLEKRGQALWFERIQFEEALQRSEQDLRLIIERRKADEALRVSEEKFAKVFHAIPDVMLISSLVDGRFLEVNLADQEIIGYREEEILGRTSTELNLWPDPMERTRMIERLQKHGTIQNIEVEVRARSGEKRVALFSAEGIEIDGMPCILSVLRDITDRFQAEEKVRERAALLDHARDAVSVFDLEDRITYWNRSAERLFGWSAEETLGESAAELLFRTESTQPLEARRGVAERGEWIGELGHITKSGEEIVVESWWTLVRDNAGQPRATLVISGDIAGRARGHRTADARPQA